MENYENLVLDYPFKKWRSELIKSWYPDRKFICFTCGNAGRELRKLGCNVLCIGDNEELKPNVWFTPVQIKNLFPERIDVTSGHLGMYEISQLGMWYKAHIGELPNYINYVATGSGETLIALCLAYPNNRFIAVYDMDDGPTRYEEFAPLNELVEAFALEVRFAKEEKNVQSCAEDK